MAWDKRPNFDDPYAKIEEKVHHQSGAKIIHVLYGARDAKGNPTYPENHLFDGHGHWIALEIEGLYQMLSWRHPEYEGGRQEYGKDRKDNALFDLEKDITEKEKLCARADMVANSKDWKKGSVELSQIFDEWKKIFNWNTPKEKVLWEKYQSAKNRFYDSRKEFFESNRRAKEKIISKVSSLAYSSEWKTTGDEQRKLLDEYKSISSAGREHEDKLWADLRQAQQKFYDRRKTHYEEMDRVFLKNASEKARITDNANWIANSRDYSKENTERMKEFDREWKTIGHAGKEKEETLWKLFSSAKDSFWTGKKVDSERRQSDYRQKSLGAIDRRKDQIRNLESQIHDLQYKMSGMRNMEYIKNMSGWIKEKQDKIKALEYQIRDIESKL